MKIYEKPMAIIENINCEDIMTTSPVVNENTSSAAYTDLKQAAGGAAEAIIFEW